MTTVRQRRRRVRTLFAAALALTLGVLAGCGTNFGTTADGLQRYRWKMTVTVGTTSTWYLAAEKFGEDLARETDGRITLQVFASERLTAGEPTAGVEQLMDGGKDFSYNSPIIYAGVNPVYGAAAAPFRFDSVEDGYAAMQGAGGEAYRQQLAEDGVELLGWGESGMRQLTNSHRAIHAPADMHGLKFRIPGFGLYTDFYRSLGSNPVGMPFSEVYTALQQGAIDGQENPLDVIYSSSLEEVQPYLTLWDYSYDPLVFGMNKDLFDSLSEDDRELVKRLAADANEFQVQQNRELEAQELEELEAAGMQVNEMTDAEKEEFKAELAPLYEKYREVWGPTLSAEFIPEGY